MTDLSLVSCLSGHHDRAAGAIAHGLGEKLALEVDFDLSSSHSERRRRIDEGTADVVWMCGHLTRLLSDEGRIGVDIVAAPVFRGERAPVYRTLILVPDSSPSRSLTHLRGSRLVINEEESWSGHHALTSHLHSMGESLGFFGSVAESGAHSASLEWLRKGSADCATIDSSIWSLLPDDVRADLRVVAVTRDWPAPPFAVSHRLDSGLRREIAQVLAGLDRPDPAVESIVRIDAGAYDGMAAVPLTPGRSKRSSH